MRRTKEWWARVAIEDRNFLRKYEIYRNMIPKRYSLPDCLSGWCAHPGCEKCQARYEKIIRKAKGYGDD